MAKLIITRHKNDGTEDGIWELSNAYGTKSNRAYQAVLHILALLFNLNESTGDM